MKEYPTASSKTAKDSLWMILTETAPNVYPQKVSRLTLKKIK